MERDARVRVLIAEDDFLVGREVRRLAEEAGYEVVGEAANGLQAVEMTVSLRPDAVLLDIKMPRMDGLEAARRIQRERPTPVVFLTAHESAELVEQATAAGAGAYLVKPPDRAQIERAVTVAMARHGDLMELRRLYAEVKSAKEELQRRFDEIKVLRGLLPICAQCKKVRDDRGYWNEVEVYVRARTEAEFTHSICPTCAKKLYPELFPEEDGV